MGRYDLYQRRKPVGMIIFLLILLLITAAGAWFYWRSTQPIEPEAETETREIAVPEPQNVIEPTESGVTAESDAGDSAENDGPDEDTDRFDPASLPSLKQSDDYFRGKLSDVSPELAGWLNTAEPIRKIMLIINDFSQGQRLYKHMRPFQLQEPFIAEEDSQGLYLPAKSFQRYNELAEAIDSTNVQEVLAFYKQFRPLFEEVYAEFGYPEGYRLEDLVKKAAAEILSAPVVESRIALVKPSVHYKFADEHLEELSPVHKQMLRMGPQNTRIIQNKLRLLIEALVNMNESP